MSRAYKKCPGCDGLNHTRTKVCYCGYVLRVSVKKTCAQCNKEFTQWHKCTGVVPTDYPAPTAPLNTKEANVVASMVSQLSPGLVRVQKAASEQRSLYWFKQLECSRPVLYATFLTPAEAADMCKGFHSYGQVLPVMTAP